MDGHPCRLGISNHIYSPAPPRSIWLMMRRIDDEDLRHASSNYSKSRAVRLAFNTWRNGTLAKISLSGYIFMSVQEMPSANEKWACVFFSNGFLSDRFVFFLHLGRSLNLHAQIFCQRGSQYLWTLLSNSVRGAFYLATTISIMTHELNAPSDFTSPWPKSNGWRLILCFNHNAWSGCHRIGWTFSGVQR